MTAIAGWLWPSRHAQSLPDISRLIRGEFGSSEVGIATIPAGIHLLKVNNRSTRTRCEICSKLTIKTPERRQWRCSGVFIANFEHISHLVLVFLFLTLNM